MGTSCCLFAIRASFLTSLHKWSELLFFFLMHLTDSFKSGLLIWNKFTLDWESSRDGFPWAVLLTIPACLSACCRHSLYNCLSFSLSVGLLVFVSLLIYLQVFSSVYPTACPFLWLSISLLFRLCCCLPLSFWSVSVFLLIVSLCVCPCLTFCLRVSLFLYVGVSIP